MLPRMPFPEGLDDRLNIGSRYSEFAISGVRTISLRRDPVAQRALSDRCADDRRHQARHRRPDIRHQKPGDCRPASRRVRAARTRHGVAVSRNSCGRISRRNFHTGSPIRLERLAVELERSLDKDTIFVTECDSGKSMDQLMSFGGEDKTYFIDRATGARLGRAAAFGAKLAKPDRPVVAILGDGAMLFGGMQPLWSLARYKA